MAKTMAEVLAAHSNLEWSFEYGGFVCAECGWQETYARSHAQDAEAGARAAHQSAALSAAGYGLVADAKREAWDEGFTACAYEHMAQDRDPSHPITRTNPCRKASNDDQ